MSWCRLWILVCFVCAWVPITLSSNHANQVHALRSNGKQCLTRHNYKQAIQYYSAILQLVEGMPGEESFELRRRCGLTLAECELREGNYKRAVARCSEVIEESANYLEHVETQAAPTGVPSRASLPFSAQLSDRVDLLKTLSRAHARRAHSFKKLNLLSLAMLDMRDAAKYQPEDARCKKEIAALKAKLGTTLTAKCDDQREALRDFADNCLMQHARPRLSKASLNKLSKVSAKPAPVLAGTHSAGGASSLFGTSAPSSLGGLFGSGGGGSNVAFLLQTLLGWDATKARRIARLISIVQGLYRYGSQAQKQLVQHKDLVLLVATLLWVMAALRS